MEGFEVPLGYTPVNASDEVGLPLQHAGHGFLYYLFGGFSQARGQLIYRGGLPGLPGPG